jgi:hypothetical protein
MRDQFAGDISDLLKFSLLRALAKNDKRLGIGWYFVQGHNNRHDGRHREFCDEPKWKSLDEEVWKALIDLPERSVKALEELPIWPDGTKFYREPIKTGVQRQEWFDDMKNHLSECNLVFLDPDNGLGRADELHTTTDEVGQIRLDGRYIVLIKFPAFVQRDMQIKQYHKQLFEEAGAKSILTITTSVMINGKPRIRWFTIIDGTVEIEKRATRFADKLNLIKGCKAACFKGDEPWGRKASGTSFSRNKSMCNICPECDYQFNGRKFTGIDAHWKAKHENIMPYAEAWPLIKSGKYRRHGLKS